MNGLTLADDAVFRDEPLRFLVGAETEAKAAEPRVEIEEMRASGEPAEIITRMRLEWAAWSAYPRLDRRMGWR